MAAGNDLGIDCFNFLSLETITVVILNRLGIDCQIISRASNLNSNLNSAAWQSVAKVLSALNQQNNLQGV